MAAILGRPVSDEAIRAITGPRRRRLRWRMPQWMQAAIGTLALWALFLGLWKVV